MAIEGITGVNNADYTEYAGAAHPAESETGIDFSTIIAEAMKDELTKSAITAQPGASGMPVGYMPIGMETQGIEQMIIAAASSGEVDDAQIALFML